MEKQDIDFGPRDIIYDVLEAGVMLKDKLDKHQQLLNKLIKATFEVQQENAKKGILFESSNSAFETVREKYKEALETEDKEIDKARKRVFALIKKAGEQVYITNQHLSKLLTEQSGKKWIILEGGELFTKMVEKCKLVGLYAICETHKLFYKEAYSMYRTQIRKLHKSFRTQYDYDTYIKSPKIIADAPDFNIITELTGEIEDCLQETRKEFINLNWVVPYLVKKCGLTVNDIFYSNYKCNVTLDDGFGKVIYDVIDNYIKDLRFNSFYLMGSLTVDE